jgi:hypothetical protein
MQLSNINMQQQIHLPNTQLPPMMVEVGSSYRPFTQAGIYPQAVYPMGSQYFHPQYLVQPVPVVRKHPQYDLNPNFDYESANLLC